MIGNILGFYGLRALNLQSTTTFFEIGLDADSLFSDQHNKLPTYRQQDCITKINTHHPESPETTDFGGKEVQTDAGKAPDDASTAGGPGGST